MKQKVVGEAIVISAHRLEQHFRGNAVETREVRIEQHLLPADRVDALVNARHITGLPLHSGDRTRRSRGHALAISACLNAILSNGPEPTNPETPMTR